MKETTQAFLLGVSAALAGLLLYVCITFAGPTLLGGRHSGPRAKPAREVVPTPPPAMAAARNR